MCRDAKIGRPLGNSDHPSNDCQVTYAAQTRSLLVQGALFLSVLGLLGCSNELQVFCQDSTETLCKTCFECGANDWEASELCGLAVETNQEGCELILMKVCASDARAYNAETAKSCLHDLTKVTCESLRNGGKPDSCVRLF